VQQTSFFQKEFARRPYLTAAGKYYKFGTGAKSAKAVGKAAREKMTPGEKTHFGRMPCLEFHLTGYCDGSCSTGPMRKQHYVRNGRIPTSTLASWGCEGIQPYSEEACTERAIPL
jgi:hypothetical protein